MVTQLEYQNILLCTDYSKDADAAFVHAYDQANKYGAKIHIMNVIPSVNPCGLNIFKKPMSKSEAINQADKIDERHRLQELGALKKVYQNLFKPGIDHEFIVRVGSPDVEIVKYSEKNNIDMIILGTMGHHENKRRTHVRTAENVSKYANCQVITIGSPKR